MGCTTSTWRKNHVGSHSSSLNSEEVCSIQHAKQLHGPQRLAKATKNACNFVIYQRLEPGNSESKSK